MNLDNSLAMQSRAAARIPGMTQLLSKRPDMFSRGVWPGYYQKAAGVCVWDLDGNRYIDMSIAGIGANVLGYADPDVNAAVIQAVTLGSSSSLNCPEEVELAELLVELHPWADMARFTRSGGEAMTVAVRVARAATGRDKVAFCGYHGWHDWYLAANLGAETALDGHLLPGLSPTGVPRQLAGTALPFRYNHIAELEAILAANQNEVAAIVMEPIRSEQPQAGFLEAVRRLADEHGTVLIIDEISAAFRMNSGGAHLTFNLNPDIAVFSKAMGNGFPIGAVIGVSGVMEAAQDTFISSTMWTERIGPTAALETIKKHVRTKAGEHLMRIGQRVQDGWQRQAAAHGLDIQIGGLSPLGHFSFNNDNGLALKALFVQEMLKQGYLASTLFYAMLAHTDQHVDSYLKAVAVAFQTIASARKRQDVTGSLDGLPALAGFKRIA